MPCCEGEMRKTVRGELHDADIPCFFSGLAFWVLGHLNCRFPMPKDLKGNQMMYTLRQVVEWVTGSGHKYVRQHRQGMATSSGTLPLSTDSASGPAHMEGDADCVPESRSWLMSPHEAQA